MRYKNGWPTITAKHLLAVTFLASTLLLSACAGSRIVQPLNKSQWQASASIGGPLLTNKNNETEITPLASVAGAFGVSQSFTAFAGWNAGSYYYKEIVQLDAGFTHEIIQPFSMRPGITYSGILNSFTGDGGNKIYPQLDINSYWLLPGKDFIYLGISNWFELDTKKAHGKSQDNFWLGSLHLGYNKNLGKYAAGIESRFLAPFEQSDERLINFTNVNGQGAIALYLSVSRTFK